MGILNDIYGYKAECNDVSTHCQITAMRTQTLGQLGRLFPCSWPLFKAESKEVPIFRFSASSPNLKIELSSFLGRVRWKQPSLRLGQSYSQSSMTSTATRRSATTCATHCQITAMRTQTLGQLGRLFCTPQLFLGRSAVRCTPLFTASTHATWSGSSSGGAWKPKVQVPA